MSLEERKYIGRQVGLHPDSGKRVIVPVGKCPEEDYNVGRLVGVHPESGKRIFAVSDGLCDPDGNLVQGYRYLGRQVGVHPESGKRIFAVGCKNCESENCGDCDPIATDWQLTFSYIGNGGVGIFLPDSEANPCPEECEDATIETLGAEHFRAYVPSSCAYGVDWYPQEIEKIATFTRHTGTFSITASDPGGGILFTPSVGIICGPVIYKSRLEYIKFSGGTYSICGYRTWNGSPYFEFGGSCNLSTISGHAYNFWLKCTASSYFGTPDLCSNLLSENMTGCTYTFSGGLCPDWFAARSVTSYYLIKYMKCSDVIIATKVHTIYGEGGAPPFDGRFPQVIKLVAS